MGIWKESKYKPEYCDLAVETLANGKSLAALCAKIGICRETLTNWRNAHPDFSAAVKVGLMKCQAHWEDIGEDGIVGNYEKFSASPWIFTMKNRFRDDYQDDKKEDKGISDTLVEKLIDKLVD